MIKKPSASQVNSEVVENPTLETAAAPASNPSDSPANSEVVEKPTSEATASASNRSASSVNSKVVKRPTSKTTAASTSNPFDPARFRLSQDFENKVGVRKAIVTVPVRKPDRQWFVRVHPSEDWRLDTAVLELKEDRETYLVEPTLWPALPGEVVSKMLFTAINRQGVVFLWPVRLPGSDGKWDEWNRSALEAAELATTGWVRVAANMSLGAYEVFQATAELPEPEWPDIGFQKLLEVAFKDRVIRDPDHPVLRRLRGEV